MNRPIKIRQLRTPGTPALDLENEFVLRLKKNQADQLREAIKQGHSNLKDRLSIQLDFTNDKDDMRNGIITLDTIMYKARLMDLPTIMETWKTIDGKNFYKTADVFQILTIREGEDPPEEEEQKKKRRDPLKTDKKYLIPHGYTPPLKNVRKRRYRKTLRKKNLDLPEIEKEVKRILRTDNEAVSIKWEVVREEDEKKQMGDNINTSNLDEQLFGGDVSSSDDEMAAPINIVDEDEDSKMSQESTPFSESTAMNDVSKGDSSMMSQSTPLPTEFTSAMFKEDEPTMSTPIRGSPSKSKKGKKSASGGRTIDMTPRQLVPSEPHTPVNTNKLFNQLATLENEHRLLMKQRTAQENEISTLENIALKQKFLTRLSEIETMIREKETEMIELKRQIDASM